VIFRHSVNFLIIMALQLLVFNNIFFMGYINPYIYLMFILLLPLNKSNKNWLLLLAFATGIIMDSFQNSMGIHAFSCVLIMYLKTPILLNLIPQLKNKGQNYIEFSIHEFGIPTTIIYTCSLVFIHHFSIIFIEAFRFDILSLIVRTLASSFFTSLLIILFLLFNSKKSQK